MLLLLPIFLLLLTEIDQNQFLSGYWLISTEDAILKFYKDGDEYKAKLDWYLPSDIKEKNIKYDRNNPAESLRNRLVWDIDIIEGLAWDGYEWSGGTLYDAQSGKSYSCYAKHVNQNEIKLRGYLFFSLLGKSETLKRISKAKRDSIRAKNPLPSYVLE